MKSKRSNHHHHHHNSNNSSNTHNNSNKSNKKQLSPANEETFLPSPVDIYSFLDPFAPGTPFPPVLDEAEWSKAPAIDVLDRLAPPVLFFPAQVADEYVDRFCQRSSPETVISFDGFPAREIPVMRRLATMMAGILSKAAESASKASMSSSRPRNPLFQQHLNTSVFNLFSTLSAAASEARQRRKLIQSEAKVAAEKKAKQKAAINHEIDEIEKLQREIERDNKLEKETKKGKSKKAAATKPKPKSNTGKDVNGPSHSTAPAPSAPPTPAPKPVPIYDGENIPPPAFFAKDGQVQYGYSLRLMRFWRSLSQEERVRLVREEHASLTSAWMEYSEERAKSAGWCLCAHCKHRRMTVNDLTDAIYSAYCEELAEYLRNGGSKPSSLYSSELSNSLDDAARTKRFLFRSLSVVGEQALLPRYNQFILRLESFSTQAFSTDSRRKPRPGNAKDEYVSGFRQQVKKMMKERGLETEKMTISSKTPFKTITGNSSSSLTTPVPDSSTLQASKTFLQRAKQVNNDISFSIVTESEEEDYDAWAQAEFEGMGPYSWKRDFLFDAEYLKKLANLSRGPQYFRDQYGEEVDCLFGSDTEGEDEGDGDGHHEPGCQFKGPRGAIMSEDDEDLIDAETDLPIDEAELVLPGGAAVPVLPPGESEGVTQWSEASRIECGRTVFLMFASEMFQYRLSAAFLDSLAKKRQLELLAEVEEEERLERERLEREKLTKTKAKKKKTVKKPADKKAKQAKKVEISSTSESDEEVEETVDEVVEGPVDEAVETLEAVDETVVVEKIAIQQTIPKSAPMNSIFDSSTRSIFDTSGSLFDSIHPHHPPPPPLPVKDEMDFDFDPLSLVEQLSKEMNQFEFARIDSPSIKTQAPPPPGFVQPTHLTNEGLMPLEGEDAFDMPPFMMNEMHGMLSQGLPGRVPGHEAHYHQHQHQQQYQAQYQHHQAQYNHPYQPPQQYHPQSAAPGYHHPSMYQTQSPSGLATTSPPTQESRFASFFSNSIFGPSTFFKDQRQ